MSLGDLLPDIRTHLPGPASRSLGERLARVECRGITRVDDEGPLFWSDAAGANVRDVDGNVFIDLTAGFGVAAAGHANPAVTAALARQAERLPHAMGDVHPAAAKVELLERLRVVVPRGLGGAILSANGSDAVESALKTAMLATGRPGVVAFHDAYHGLGYGALSVTGLRRFRAPFEPQLHPGVRFAPFPVPDGDEVPAAAGSAGGVSTGEALAAVEAAIASARRGGTPVGAVIVEPIQGRGGVRVPPADFLPGLRALCDAHGVLLVLDEVYTGLGRTGRWFACEHWDVVPDLLVMGKALAGGLPLSAVVGTAAVMDAWPPSGGEAIHTSTFLGNPVACAAAIAHLDQLERLDLVARAERLGGHVAARLQAWVADGLAAAARGLGLMRAVAPARVDAERAAAAALAAGVLVLPEGDALALTPPLVITSPQLDHALDVIESAIGGG